MTTSIHARIRRYPAKMVPQFADRIFDAFIHEANSVLDPFCGSGEVLFEASRRGIRGLGIDVNPYASLLSQVRVEGFVRERAVEKADLFFKACASSNNRLAMTCPNSTFWFSPATLRKLETMRAEICSLNLASTREGRSVVLAASQAVRLASRADDRSPKPFISRRAQENKSGKHLNPIAIAKRIHDAYLENDYFSLRKGKCRILLGDATDTSVWKSVKSDFSHIVTSPPYINAQDYFRNFKLEMYFLEGILPFSTERLASRFIGRERRLESGNTKFEDIAALLPASVCLGIQRVHTRDQHLGSVVSRYFMDMANAIRAAATKLAPNGEIVVVCGDNLVAGVEFNTGKAISEIVASMGYRLVDTFSDKILNRLLAPNRRGHIGLIKEEVVYKFVPA